LGKPPLHGKSCNSKRRAINMQILRAIRNGLFSLQKKIAYAGDEPCCKKKTGEVERYQSTTRHPAGRVRKIAR